MKQAFLIGGKVYLRVLEAKDANGNYPEWLNNEETCQFLEQHVYPYSKESAYEYIQALQTRQDMIMLAIVNKEDDTHIGNITLGSISNLHRSAEFSLLIGEKSHKQKGLAKEASFLLLKHGFNTMNLNRIWCGTMQNNISMQKLALSLGMQKEGLKREEVFKNGRYYDTFQYSILREEFNMLNTDSNNPTTPSKEK